MCVLGSCDHLSSLFHMFLPAFWSCHHQHRVVLAEYTDGHGILSSVVRTFILAIAWHNINLVFADFILITIPIMIFSASLSRWSWLLLHGYSLMVKTTWTQNYEKTLDQLAWANTGTWSVASLSSVWREWSSHKTRELSDWQLADWDSSDVARRATAWQSRVS